VPPFVEIQCASTTLTAAVAGGLVKTPSLTLYTNVSGPFCPPAVYVTIGELVDQVSAPREGFDRMEKVRGRPGGPKAGSVRLVEELTKAISHIGWAIGPISKSARSRP